MTYLSGTAYFLIYSDQTAWENWHVAIKEYQALQDFDNIYKDLTDGYAMKAQMTFPAANMADTNSAGQCISIAYWAISCYEMTQQGDAGSATYVSNSYYGNLALLDATQPQEGNAITWSLVNTGYEL